MGKNRATKIAGTAIFFVKPVRLINVFLFHKVRETFEKDVEPDVISDPVVHGIAEDRTKDNCNKQPLDIKNTTCRCSSRDEQDGVPRKEGHDDNPGFKKDDTEQDKICPHTVLVDN